jgi:thiamine-phosphate pyrophosphorylase
MASRCLLYYITDRSKFAGAEFDRRRALIGKVSEAARAGVDYVQLREKDLNTKELEGLAREVLAAAREYSRTTRVLINSRTDVALAAGADGVHLRSEDVTPEDVRNIWSQRGARSAARVATPIIAASCHTINSVEVAAAQLASFAVLAPVFEKPGISPTPPAGLAMLGKACQQNLPVFALGGVTVENAASCLRAGADGIAAIRLFQDNKIEEVVRALRAL